MWDCAHYVEVELERHDGRESEIKKETVARLTFSDMTGGVVSYEECWQAGRYRGATEYSVKSLCLRANQTLAAMLPGHLPLPTGRSIGRPISLPLQEPAWRVCGRRPCVEDMQMQRMQRLRMLCVRHAVDN